MEVTTEYSLTVTEAPSQLGGLFFTATVTTGSGEVFRFESRSEAEAVYAAYRIMQCAGAES
jgi:hypothetical protein